MGVTNALKGVLKIYTSQHEMQQIYNSSACDFKKVVAVGEWAEDGLPVMHGVTF